MKKSIALLLLLLPVVVAEAKTIQKIVNPAYVGMHDGTMKITSVKTTEESTTVTFQYPGDGFGFFSRGSYLVDEKGKCYDLVGQRGFSVDSLDRLVPKKKGKYELCFEPLPEDTRIFDLIEDFYYAGGSRYYGIRENNTPFSVSLPKVHNEGENSFPDIDFKIDSVLVTGHVEYHNSEKGKLKEIFKYTTHTAEFPQGKRWSQAIAQVDESGNFQFKINAIGPTWSYLRLSAGKGKGYIIDIPCMLYPNDHLDIHIITDEDGEVENVTYKSSLGKDFDRLVKCAPMIAAYYDVGTIKGKDYSIDYKRMTPESVKKRFEDNDSLGLYLSGKYGLNGLETEILRSHLSVLVAMNVLELTSQYLQYLHYTSDRKDSITWKNEENRKMLRKNWINSDSPYYNICFANLRAESNAFLATPYWSTLFNYSRMNNIPRYSKLFDDFFFYKWENILGRELGNTEDGDRAEYQFHHTPEIEKRWGEFEEQQSKLYYDWMLKLIREWRQKENGDSLFEQAFLLCETQHRLPFIPSWILHTMNMQYIHQRFSQYRELFYHPSVIRMANTLLYNQEKENYKKFEQELKKHSIK